MPPFESLTLVNGRETSHVSVLDRGLAYGDGLFETMRLAAGVLPFRDLHWRRLMRGCQRLRIDLPEDELAEQLARLLALLRERGIGKAVVKLIVSRGVGGRGYLPSAASSPTLVLSAFPFPEFPEHYYQQGVRVALCRHRLPRNPALAGLKHLNRLDQVLAALEWRDLDCQEGLLLDTEGELVEAGSRNVFVVQGDCLLTPSLEWAGVAGVLRSRIMEDYAGRLGLKVRETALTLTELRAAEEIALCNSVAGVWPVRSLAGDSGEWRFTATGVSRKLQQLFEEDIRERVKQSVT